MSLAQDSSRMVVVLWASVSRGPGVQLWSCGSLRNVPFRGPGGTWQVLCLPTLAGMGRVSS